MLSIAVQVSLLAAALVDIYRRLPGEIRGNKWGWIAVSFVDLAGPISPFLLGYER